MTYTGQPLKRFEAPKLVSGRGSYLPNGTMRFQPFSMATSVPLC
jgi:hypothetical protein